jgi:hypothetical protein
LSKPEKLAEEMKIVSSLSPRRAWFVFGFDPQLKLRAIFGRRFAASNGF